MAYPAGVDFRHTGPEIGLQPINETSATQRHPLGMKVKARDEAYGEGEFIYGKGVASTAAGDFCAYDSKNGDTARAVQAGATSFGPMGVAMSANTASRYGWYQVEGAGPVLSGTVAADAPLYLTSTAGSLDDAVAAGYLVDGIVSRSASSGGFTTCQLAYPSVSATSGGTTLSALRTDLDATVVVANAAATKASILKCTLVAAAEIADVITVSGTVEDLAGLDASSAKQVLVRTLAVTADKGDIAVTTGTAKKIVNPATGENVAWIETTAAGLFAFTVTDDQVEDVLVVATTTTGTVTTLLFSLG
jgi:hypothetical protein